jgi:NitT/TauT family transport system substrate-binding protein
MHDDSRVGSAVESGISRSDFLKRGAAAGAAVAALTSPAAALAAARRPKVYTGTALDKFNWSFAIPVEDAENTAYFVNKFIFGPQEGIDLRLNSGTSTSDFIKLVASHHYNAAHPSVFLMALVKDQGLPVTMYFDNMNINIFGFAVKANSPIKSIKDFQGKKIAIAVVGWDAIWNPDLAAAGVDPKSVSYLVTGLGPGRLNALNSGKVDIMVTWNGEFPVWNWQAKLAGKGPLRFFSGDRYFKTPANGWTAATDRLDRDRDMLIRAARAQAKAMWFVKTNPTEAAKIFHHYYPKIAVHKNEAEEIAADYNNTGFLAGPDGTLPNRLGWNSQKRWQTLLDSMYKNKLTKHHLKAKDMYTNDFIKEINDYDNNEVIAVAKKYRFKKP